MNTSTNSILLCAVLLVASGWTGTAMAQTENGEPDPGADSTEAAQRDALNGGSSFERPYGTGYEQRFDRMQRPERPERPEAVIRAERPERPTRPDRERNPIRQ